MLEKLSCNEQAEDAVVLIHGYGASKEDLWDLRGLFPGCAAFSLQAPIALPWGGYSWFDIDFTPFGSIYDEEGLEEAITCVQEFLGSVRAKYKRLMLFGFSQGSIISHAVYLRTPELIDGAACLSGRYVESVFGSVEKGDVANKPLFVSHGTEDVVVPFENGEMIRDYYGPKAVFKEYRMGHEINPSCQGDVNSWFNSLA